MIAISSASWSAPSAPANAGLPPIDKDAKAEEEGFDAFPSDTEDTVPKICMVIEYSNERTIRTFQIVLAVKDSLRAPSSNTASTLALI